MRIARYAVAALSFFAIGAAVALPVVDEPFALRLQNSANSNNFATGDTLFWGASSVPGGESFWAITRQCPIGGTCVAGPPPTGPSVVGQALFYRPFTLFPNQYFASRPYNSALTGPWTLIVSSQATRPVPGQPFDPLTTAFVNTPAVGNVGRMPFVTSMTVTGAGLTPSLKPDLALGRGAERRRRPARSREDPDHGQYAGFSGYCDVTQSDILKLV